MNEQARPITLRTIADQLGLHISTVSRVLHAKPDQMARAASQDTIERIRRLADELGYRPNPHATSLKTRRSNVVGVLVPRLSDLVLATIYEGIEAAASERNLSAFVSNTGDVPDVQRQRTEMVLSRRVDGMIFGDAHFDAGFVDEVAARGVPFVLVNRRAGNHPSVTCDDCLGGRLVAEHLIALGHERVAVIAGKPHSSTGIDRAAGFVERYREAGVKVPEQRVLFSHFDTAGGRAATEKLLREGPHPTAIFAVNDFDAIGAMGAVRDHGLRVGEDVAVIGFNDTPLAAELPIPLTSVNSSMHEMGRRSLEMLVRVVGGESVESLRLTPTLVVRASSDPNALADVGCSPHGTKRS